MSEPEKRESSTRLGIEAWQRVAEGHRERWERRGGEVGGMVQVLLQPSGSPHYTGRLVAGWPPEGSSEEEKGEKRMELLLSKGSQVVEVEKTMILDVVPDPDARLVGEDT